jgi:multiple sugar transport system substrate-binding protein
MSPKKSLLSRRSFLKASAIAGAGAAVGLSSARSSMAARPSAPSGNITYWHHYTSESEMAGLKEGADMFSKKYPGATVESVTVPNADFMAKFTLAASPTQPWSQPTACRTWWAWAV